jgi:DNA-binding NarL/FixJ family response regulator
LSDAKSILLIDGIARDRRHYADVLKAVLPTAVFFEAENGEDGLTVVRSRPIDAVILELSLPDMSGFDVLKQLAAVAPLSKNPVIVLTRLSYESLFEIAKENGANAAFLKKATSDRLFGDTVFNALYPSRPAPATMPSQA